MIDAVLTFAFITAVGELLVLLYLHPLTRLRLLGSKHKLMALHIAFAALNLWIHWGTITGSMTAVTAFVVSIGVTNTCRVYYGAISNGRYIRGMKTYRRSI